MLKLTFITEEQDKRRYEYTDHDVNDLAVIAEGILSIAHVYHHYACDYPYGEKKDRNGAFPAIFPILEMLMEPIHSFLFEGAPMADEEAVKDKGDVA
jgi:hypothetical protein